MPAIQRLALGPKANTARAVARAPRIARAIILAIARGLTRTQAAEAVGISWDTAARALDRACQDDPDIARSLALARRSAADRYVAKANELAAGPGADDDSMVRVGRDRLGVDQARWMARVYDPDTYGDRTTVAGTAPVTIIVTTGIPERAARQRVTVDGGGGTPNDR